MKKQIAGERIKILFEEADKIFIKDKSLASNYVKKARKIAMKVNLKLPRPLKRKFCKHCYNYLRPGINSRTRISKSRITILCKECKKYTRIPVKTKK